MNLLFYFVHPAKYHAFRRVINILIAEGHNVDVAIIKKDILEDLVKSESWNYVNIFPEGRRINGLPSQISAFINLFRTIYRLLKVTRGKKYDLCITDDLFTFAGRMKGIPVIFFTDDDLSAVPESAILMITANYIFSPSVAYMGVFEKKKIGYYGYKSMFQLHPNRFTPDRNLLHPSLAEKAPFFMIRLVSVTSTHDLGNKGIDDDLLKLLVAYLETYGKVVINSERSIPDEFSKYVLDINRRDIAHYLAFAKIFISDSTTMCAEAAVLGTPSIEIDDWFDDFRQYEDLNKRYGLVHGFKPEQWELILGKINELLVTENLAALYQRKRKELLNNNIDVTAFLHWIIVNYPDSVKEYFENKDIQLRFK